MNSSSVHAYELQSWTIIVDDGGNNARLLVSVLRV